MRIGAEAVLYFDAPDRGAALARLIEDNKKFRDATDIGWRYYENKNDILSENNKERIDRLYEHTKNPLRSADNKVSHPYHQMLVDQKAGYMFGKLVVFRPNNSENKRYGARLQELSQSIYPQLAPVCIDASNTGISYLQTYISPDGDLRFSWIPSREGIPLWGATSERPMEGFIRYYQSVDYDEAGQIRKTERAEVWTAKDKTVYVKTGGRFVVVPGTKEHPNPAPYFYKNRTIFPGRFPQSFGSVPFAVIKNSLRCASDLEKVKRLIDIYDQTVSLYANDIEDLQELIFVLINYGGQDYEEFLSDLKKYKVVNISKQGGGTDGGVETLKVDIPVDARIKLLEILHKNIWSMGQGVDPYQVPSNPSGAALKFLYGALEIKASLAEAGFREAFNTVLKLFKQWLKISAGEDYTRKSEDIIYTRSMISNDAETVQMCQNSKGVISDETIAANHPWVDDVQTEMKKLREQELQKLKDEAGAYLDGNIPFEDNAGGNGGTV